ncbi:MAG: DUF86 domain-containing protein [Rhodanobacteraceae bacterium]
MNPEERLADWLDNMLVAASQARAFVEGKDRDDFLADKRTQQAVAMNLLIIGEVASKALEQHADTLAGYPQLPWTSMKGMRNRIAHGYFELDFSVVWQTVQRSLPELIDKLPAIIDAIRPHSGE